VGDFEVATGGGFWVAARGLPRVSVVLIVLADSNSWYDSTEFCWW